MGIWPCVFIPIFCALVYLLHRLGLAVTKCVAAVRFVFWPGKDGDRAQLDACTGWVCRAARFREGGTYAFSLDLQTSRGNVEVCLLDRDKRPLLRLDRDSPSGQAELNRKGQYYLRWKFQNATGRCGLSWRK